MVSRMKKMIPRIIALSVILTTFAIIWQGLRYILLDDAESYTRIAMHEFYNQENVDVLFMGASHCFRGFNTDIMDEMLDCNTFNLGSASQPIDITYLLMKEAISKYNIKHVYVDLSYNVAKISIEKGKNLTRIYIITDYMRPSVDKYVYLFNQAGEGNYINAFLPARRNWTSIVDFDYVYSLVKKKRSYDYINYEYVENGGGRYAGKGFIENDGEIADGTFKDTYENELFDVESIDNKWVTTISNMIDYCKRKDVDITFLSVPISSYRLMCYENYDDYISFINNLIGENDVEYIDFNLMREKYWPDTSLYYMDYSHLNKVGAGEFSKIFCKLINGDISDEELFYNSVAEKYKEVEASFYGVEYQMSPDDRFFDCRMVTSGFSDLLNQVTLISENGEEVIKETSYVCDFKIPSDFTGICEIEVFGNNGSSKLYNINF